MKRDLVPTAAIGLIALIAIASGLWFSGGRPIARAERLDETRRADLNAMSRMIRCTAGLHGQQLPETYLIDPSCDDGKAHADPASGEPYAYTKLSVQGYMICAQFEIKDDPRFYDFAGGSYNQSTGCVTWIYRP